MTIWQQLKQAGLIDTNKMVTLTGQPDGSDNGTLYTAQYLLLAAKAGEGISQEHINALFAIQQCLNGGNPIRRPGDFTQNSPDNLISCCAVSTTFATTVYDYGWPLFNYNTENPKSINLSSWMGRQPGLIGYMQMRAKAFVNPLRVLALFIGVWLTSREPLTSTSDRLLAQLIVDTLPVTWYTERFINWWGTKTRSQYARGINDCVLTYFGPQHTFSQLDWYTGKPLTP
jgi:hypothetical protein